MLLLKTSLVLILLTANVGHSSGITYFSGRDVFADFENFLENKHLEKTRSYQGIDRGGKICRFTISKNSQGFTFFLDSTPEFRFVVPKYPSSGLNIDGGFEGDFLWASYFIDAPNSHLHGQFGEHTEIRLNRDAQKQLRHFQFLKVRQEDLNYQKLASMDCFNPK